MACYRQAEGRGLHHVCRSRLLPAASLLPLKNGASVSPVAALAEVAATRSLYLRGKGLRVMLPAMQKDFREIAHCGGRIIVTTKIGEHGERLISTGIHHASTGPAAWFGVYILPQLGIPVGTIRNLGLSDEGPPQT